MTGNAAIVLIGLWLCYRAIFSIPAGEMSDAELAAAGMAVIALAAWARRSDAMLWPSATNIVMGGMIVLLGVMEHTSGSTRWQPSGSFCLPASRSLSSRCGRSSTVRLRASPQSRSVVGEEPKRSGSSPRVSDGSLLRRNAVATSSRSAIVARDASQSSMPYRSAELRLRKAIVGIGAGVVGIPQAMRRRSSKRLKAKNPRLPVRAHGEGPSLTLGRNALTKRRASRIPWVRGSPSRAS